MNINTRNSFSLIELLVVVVIIGVLAGLGFLSYSNALKSSRDGRRKADLEQIHAALEMYKSDNGVYPAVAPGNCTNVAGSLAPYLPIIPPDPKPASFHYYCIVSAVDYTLGAMIESSAVLCPSPNTDCDVGGYTKCNYLVGPYGKICGQ